MLSVDAADDDGSEVDAFFSLLSVTVLTSALSSNGKSVMMVPVVVAFAVVVTGVTVKVSGIEVIERGMASEETVTGTAVAGIRVAAVVVWPLLLSVLSTEGPLVLVAGSTSTVLARRDPDLPSVELLLSDSSRLAPSLEKVETVGGEMRWKRFDAN